MSKTTSRTLTRVAKYTTVRVAFLSITIVIGVFLAIIATNYGGYIDDIFREGVDYGIVTLSRSMRDIPMEQRLKILEQARWEMEEEAVVLFASRR